MDTFDRFTNRARQVIILARKEADRFNHNYIGTEHILLAIIRLGQGVAVEVMREMGLDFETLRIEVEKSVGTGPETKTIGDVPFTAKAKRVIELAAEEARGLNHTYIGTEHILLGLLREAEGVAARILKNLDVDIEEARQRVLDKLGAQFGHADEGMGKPGEKKVKSPALRAFGRNLTELACKDQLDPVIDRVDEIQRVIQVLCRRRKNNPVGHFRYPRH